MENVLPSPSSFSLIFQLEEEKKGSNVVSLMRVESFSDQSGADSAQVNLPPEARGAPLLVGLGKTSADSETVSDLNFY